MSDPSWYYCNIHPLFEFTEQCPPKITRVSARKPLVNLTVVHQPRHNAPFCMGKATLTHVTYVYAFCVQHRLSAVTEI